MIATTLRELVAPHSLSAGAPASANPGADPRAWRELLRAAERSGVLLPALSAAWEAPWRGYLPELVQIRLEERLQRERLLLAVLENEQERAAALLHDARIDVAVLGELDLSRRFYPARRPRGAAVARILVPRDALSEALRCLGSAGYRRVEGSGAVDLERRPSRAVVRIQEVLWQGESRAATGGVWDRSLEGAAPGVPRGVRALAAEDCLAWAVCEARGIRGLDSPLLLNDLHFVLARSPRLDWSRAIRALAERRACAAAWYALKRFAAEGRLAVPAEPFGVIEREVGPLRRRLIQSLAREGRLPEDALLRDTLLRGKALHALLAP